MRVTDKPSAFTAARDLRAARGRRFQSAANFCQSRRSSILLGMLRSAWATILGAAG